MIWKRLSFSICLLLCLSLACGPCLAGDAILVNPIEPVSAATPFEANVSQPAVPETHGTPEMASPTGKDGCVSFALTLAGGGARGAAHIGVLKVLEKEGIKPSFVSGSSIGAVIGSLYCAGVPVTEIEKLMVSGKVRKAFLPIPMPLQIAVYSPKYITLRLLQLKPNIGLYSGRSVERFINKNLPADVKRIEDMKIPFAVIATNLEDTRSIWICKGNVGKAVRASASIPFMYRPTNIEGSFLLDGGIRSNLPTDPARASGTPIVIAVRLHSTLRSKPASDFKTIMSYSDRIMSILMAEIESKNTSDADIIIEPEIFDFHLYSFSRESLVQAIAAGEEAALKMLPKIKEALQSKQVCVKTKDRGR